MQLNHRSGFSSLPPTGHDSIPAEVLVVCRYRPPKSLTISSTSYSSHACLFAFAHPSFRSTTESTARLILLVCHENIRTLHSGRNRARSTEQRSAARLDSLDLSSGEGDSAEALGKLISIEVDALRRLDGAEVGGGLRANAVGGGNGFAQGSVLLSMVTIGREGGVRVATILAAAETCR